MRRFVNHPANAERVARIAGSLLERVTLPPEPQCLEIGCGQGAVTRLLVEQYGARVVASDYDPAQVALAQERLADLDERVAFRVVDARAMPFDDAQFDGVFSIQVMHHIPGGWREVLAETARVLRPGGWFVFTDLVVSPRAGRLLRHLLPRLDLQDWRRGWTRPASSAPTAPPSSTWIGYKKLSPGSRGATNCG